MERVRPPLMRLVAGLDEPDSGSVELGSTVEICFADQSRQDLNDKKNHLPEYLRGI